VGEPLYNPPESKGKKQKLKKQKLLMGKAPPIHWRTTLQRTYGVMLKAN